MQTTTPTEEQRMSAARAYARWSIGDANWADNILRAYNDPEATMQWLREEREAK